MENLELGQRKRHSSPRKMSPVDVRRKKKCIHPGTMQSPSSFQPEKLIDQLYQTWKNANDLTKQAGPSQEELKSQVSQKRSSRQAALNLKKLSLNQKLSELKKEKLIFGQTQVFTTREQKFCFEMLNDAREYMNSSFEDVKYMFANEVCIQQHFNDFSEIVSVILQKLREKKEKLVVAPSEASYLDTEICTENIEIQNLDKILWELKLEDEKVIEQECSPDDMEQNLHSIKNSNVLLIEEEISLESALREENDPRLEQDRKYYEDQQELKTKFNELETVLEDFVLVDEMLKSINSEMNEIMSRKLNPDSFTEIDFIKEIQQMDNKIKEYELRSHYEERNMKITKSLELSESRLIDIKKATDLILLQTIDMKKLDESLIEINQELELLQKELISEKIESSKHTLEDLIHQREIVDQENVDILRAVDEYSKYEEEEQLIRDLKLDLAKKEKIHQENIENYNKIKEINSEHLKNHPHLLHTKHFEDFKDMKKKAEATIVSSQKRENSLEKRNEFKLKELEQKAHKLSAAIKEIDDESSSVENKFADLEMQIKNEEQKLEKIKNTIPKKALPIIRQNESVQVDTANLTWMQSFSQNFQLKPTITLFSDDESLDNRGFNSFEKVHQPEPVVLNNKQENIKDLNKELPLSQSKSLKSLSPDRPQSNKEVSSQLSQITLYERLYTFGKSVPSPSQVNMKKSLSQRSADSSQSESTHRLSADNKKFFKRSTQPVQSKKRSRSVPPKKI